MGLEPTTPRLEVWCAIHCATLTRIPVYISSSLLKGTFLANVSIIMKSDGMYFYLKHMPVSRI